MNSKTIKRYKNKTPRELIKIATRYFNAYIRKRDGDKPCISCGKYTTLQAGHFFSGGHHAALKFSEVNVNGQCVRCNMYLSGNLLGYQQGLVKKYGIIAVKELENLAAYHKRKGYKWDRFFLIEIITDYKEKLKQF